MNRVMLVGNLTADPEMRSTGSGISVCTFRVAIDRRFKDSDGNKATDYIPVTCWRQLADLCSRYLAKGRKVAVVGSLQMNNYEDKNGNKRTSYTVVADEVEFLTPKNQDNSQSGYGDAYEEFGDSELPF